MPETEEQIEQRYMERCRIADAKLEVAESLAWFVMFGWASAAHLKWGSWVITIIAAIASYLMSSYGFRIDSKRAQAAYNKRPTASQYESIP